MRGHHAGAPERIHASARSPAAIAFASPGRFKISIAVVWSPTVRAAKPSTDAMWSRKAVWVAPANSRALRSRSSASTRRPRAASILAQSDQCPGQRSGLAEGLGAGYGFVAVGQCAPPVACPPVSSAGAARAGETLDWSRLRLRRGAADRDEPEPRLTCTARDSDRRPREIGQGLVVLSLSVARPTNGPSTTGERGLRRVPRWRWRSSEQSIRPPARKPVAGPSARDSSWSG
jgi:hypothetical protein